MWNFVFKWLYLPSFLFLTVCQPIQYSQLNPSQADLLLNSSHEESFQRQAFLRSSQKEFKEAFLSDKLDLVFVLDTNSYMNSLYQKNLFGADFLNRFQNYDWKFAYTDMSIDMQRLIQQEETKENEKEEKEEEEEEEEESCGFFSGVAMTVFGLAGGHPLLSGFGLDSLVNCFSSLDVETKSETKEKPEEVFTNGSFLPFEYNGVQQLKSDGFHQLTQSVENYNVIFDHSLRLGNAKAKGSSYEAPEQRESDPYPFLAMAFSMAKGNSHPIKSSSNEPGSSFFRKDSLIVYVLITVQDMKVVISPEKFKQSIGSFFGSEERVKLIPITLNPDSSLFCSLNFQKVSNDSSKVRKLANQLGHASLDICSQNLADELFAEISKSLYPKGFLSE